MTQAAASRGVRSTAMRSPDVRCPDVRCLSRREGSRHQREERRVSAVSPSSQGFGACIPTPRLSLHPSRTSQGLLRSLSPLLHVMFTATEFFSHRRVVLEAEGCVSSPYGPRVPDAPSFPPWNGCLPSPHCSTSRDFICATNHRNC